MTLVPYLVPFSSSDKVFSCLIPGVGCAWRRMIKEPIANQCFQNTCHIQEVLGPASLVIHNFYFPLCFLVHSFYFFYFLELWGFFVCLFALTEAFEQGERELWEVVLIQIPNFYILNSQWCYILVFSGCQWREVFASLSFLMMFPRDIFTVILLVGRNLENLEGPFPPEGLLLITTVQTLWEQGLEQQLRVRDQGKASFPL